MKKLWIVLFALFGLAVVPVLYGMDFQEVPQKLSSNEDLELFLTLYKGLETQAYDVDLLLKIKALLTLTFFTAIQFDINDSYVRQVGDFFDKFGHPFLYNLLESIDELDAFLYDIPIEDGSIYPIDFLLKSFATIHRVFIVVGEEKTFQKMAKEPIVPRHLQDHEKLSGAFYHILAFWDYIFSRVCTEDHLYQHEKEIQRKLRVLFDILFRQVNYEHLDHSLKKTFRPFNDFRLDVFRDAIASLFADFTNIGEPLRGSVLFTRLFLLYRDHRAQALTVQSLRS